MKHAFALLLLNAALPVAAQSGGSSMPGSVVEMTLHDDAEASAGLGESFQASPGHVASIWLTAFYALAPEHDPERPVRVHLAEFESQELLALAMDDSPELEALAHIAMRPFDPADRYSVSSLVQPGQVLEVAVRDLTAYDDRDAFFGTIGAFVELLASRPGVLREYQWLSVNGDTFVGMTVYRDMEAFGAVSQDEAVLGSPEAAALFASYPPNIAQYLVLDAVE